MPAPAAHGFTFFPAARGYGHEDRWLALLEETTESFALMGINLERWKRTRGFKQLLGEKADAGCRIRIMLMDPANPSLPGLINESVRDVQLTDVLDGLDNMRSYLSGMTEGHPNIEVRTIVIGAPHLNLVVTDQRAIGVQYLWSERANTSPLWETERTSPLYTTFAREFDAFWEANAPDTVSGLHVPESRPRGRARA